MRVVIHPGQKARQEQHGRDAHDLENGHFRVLEGGPLVYDLHHGQSQKAEVGSGGADFGPVGYENGRGQVSHHAWSQIDHGDSGRSTEFFQITH